MWYKVSVAKEPKLFDLEDAHVFTELLLAFTEGARHTVPMVIATTTKASYRFRNTQEAEAFLAEVDVVRDRLEETLGEDGVLILPAATKTAPYHRQDIYFNESPEMTALFSILKMPATACPVMKSANGLPLAVQVVAKRGNDRLCLAVAREIERQFGGWIQPWVRN
ncbi:fatty-acid amide hydrolase 2-like [Amblyomma americanum]